MNRWWKHAAWLALLGVTCSAPAWGADLEFTSRGDVTRVRVQVVIGEQPLEQRWDDNFAALVAYCDRDGDGGLSDAEAARLPSPYALREVLSCGFVPQLGSAPPWGTLDKNADGKAEVTEVAAWYRAQGIGAPLVGAVVVPHTKALNRALATLLDRCNDGRVTAVELEHSSSAIERFDRNDDELIGAGELVAGTLYPGAAPSQWLAADRENGDAPFRLVVEQGSASPTHTVAVNWPQPLEKASQIKRPVEKTSSSLALALRGDEGRLAERVKTNVDRLTVRFAEDDADHDDILSSEEIEKDKDNPWRTLLRAADRNADAQLAKAELTGWLALQRKLAESQVLLSVFYVEHGLFEVLDVDHDGALSRQELAQSHKSLAAVSALVDNRLALNKLPDTVMITVSQGYPRAALGQPERVGPAWFLAMDRNADGAVSQREFTGPADAFLKLDADHDSVLTATEVGNP